MSLLFIFQKMKYEMRETILFSFSTMSPRTPAVQQNEALYLPSINNRVFHL